MKDTENEHLDPLLGLLSFLCYGRYLRRGRRSPQGLVALGQALIASSQGQHLTFQPGQDDFLFCCQFSQVFCVSCQPVYVCLVRLEDLEDMRQTLVFDSGRHLLEHGLRAYLVRALCHQ